MIDRLAHGSRTVLAVTAICLVSTVPLACQPIADFPGYTATFTNESNHEVLVRFEDGVLRIDSRQGEESPGTSETLYVVPPGVRSVGVEWVHMKWGGGSENPPDPVGHVRVLTLDCQTIGLFEVRKGGGEPRVLIGQTGMATVSYAGGGNPEASISQSDLQCPSGAGAGLISRDLARG